MYFLIFLRYFMSVFYLGIWAVCMMANVKLAKKNHRDVMLWAILSAFFSVITLIANILLPPEGEKKE